MNLGVLYLRTAKRCYLLQRLVNTSLEAHVPAGFLQRLARRIKRDSKRLARWGHDAPGCFIAPFSAHRREG